MKKVESFELDHRKVKAPYIRRCAHLEGVEGNSISKFDIRFLQPNEEAFGTAAMHALEHILAYNVRGFLDGVIDISPMGCRTGFYLIVWGDRDCTEVKAAVEKVLEIVIESTDVPANNEVQCGNYKDLSLFGAKEYAKEILKKGFSLNKYGQ
ncbi:MAG: S-ribosylhomocysteine lyase [Clostridium sp.]